MPSDTIDTKEPIPLEMRLFGTFDVSVRGHALPPLRYRKELWLLALLALRHDRDVPRDWLATTFWPDNEESKGLFYLRKALSNLRTALGEEASRLQSPTPRTVRLDLSGAMVDIVRFDSDTQAGQEERLQEAVNLYRGPLLQDCPEEWVLTERYQREQSYLTALEQLARLTLARGESVAAVRWLRLTLVTEPYRESAACALMQALADSGDRAAVQQVYKELRLRLRQDLNTSPAPETEALYKQLAQREAQAISLPSSPAPTTPSLRHLPVPLTDLIGREQEIAEVSGWLERRRLVTLLGTGGVGKTRLSIAAAEAVLPRFEGGVWFVDLAPLTEPSYVPDVVAKVLGLPQEAGQSAEERLIESLETRSLLLVMDNCEHLLSACAALIDSLLSACPGLRVLATSRQALGITGEQTYPVPSLPLPSRDEVEGHSSLLNVEKNPAFILDYAGIQLFVQRAIQVNPSFRLTRDNARAVVEICHHLDGIPLALEMAAARVRSLSVEAINGKLDQRFRLLTGGSRAALPRQQTLRALIDWSYDLLTDTEKALLCRLSIFSGGWILEAAEAVCVGEPVEEWEILDLLIGLVDKSLVVAETSSTTVRYRLLETIRQYAGDQLRERGEEPDTRERYLNYFVALAHEAKPQLRGSEQHAWLDRLEAEHDNVRQVLAFCETETGDAFQKGLSLMTDLGVFWLIREHLNEGRQHCAVLLAQAEKSAPISEAAEGRMLAGNIALCLGDNTTARQYFEASLALRQQLGERRGLAGVLGSLGNVAQRQGDFPAAQGYFEESIVICREFGLQNYEATGLTCLSNLASAQMKYAEARAYAIEALSVCRQVGNPSIEILLLNGLGNIAMAQEGYAEAVSYYEQSLAIDQKVGHTAMKANVFLNMGSARAALGEIAAACVLYCEALSLKHEGGDQRTTASMLETVAIFLANQDHREAACQIWGMAEKLREDSDSPRPPREQAHYDQAIAKVRQSLESKVIETARAKGRAMTIADAIAYAIRETEMVRTAHAAL